MLKEEKIQHEFNELKSNFFIEQMEIDLTNKVQSIYTDVKGENRHDESWVCAMWVESCFWGWQVVWTFSQKGHDGEIEAQKDWSGYASK